MDGIRQFCMCGAWVVFWSLSQLLMTAARANEPETLRVMTFNMWHGGEAGDRPLEQTIELILAARPDLVGFQETDGRERNGKQPDNGQRIADKLAWHYFDQGDGTGVMSRYKIIGHTPRKWGVLVELPSARQVWLFNATIRATPSPPRRDGPMDRV